MAGIELRHDLALPVAQVMFNLSHRYSLSSIMTTCLVATACVSGSPEADDSEKLGRGGASATAGAPSGAGGSAASAPGNGGSPAAAGAPAGNAGTFAGVGGSENLGGNASVGGSANSGVSGSASVGGSAGAAPAPSAQLSKFIVVDQFGYLPDSEKIAVVRDPQTGFDAGDTFSAGATYSLIDARTSKSVLTAAATAWNGGATDASSGDKAWWFDFSKVTQPGTYYVLDVDRNVRSDLFEISESAYREVLKRAVRTFFYQRAGQAKDAKWAGAGWADGASHVGPGQDHEARLFSAKNDATTAKDVSGGWYDAGDFNKYTNWTASYVITLLHAYLENTAAWGDDYEIPESGNGIPDVLDEAKWGLDHLARLQDSDGSVLSVVGEAGASPPSAAKDPTYYGPASTSATLSTSAAYALGAVVLGSLGNSALNGYASELQSRALKAWTWAGNNPNVIFRNNEGASSGLAAGQQETDDYGRSMMKLESAVYLYQLTKDDKYRSYFDSNYQSAHQFVYSNYVSQWEPAVQRSLLYYTTIAGATEATKGAILKSYAAGMNSDDNFKAHEGKKDPYLAFLNQYTWGSNSSKSHLGSLFYDVVTFRVDPTKDLDARRAAERYVHYIHGVNPLGLVYLSNMGNYGAVNGVTEFFHTWFFDGNAKWDKVGVSSYGPPPGFLTGGPNPSYAVDGCCPGGCSGLSCTAESLSPPIGQPAQKSYKDFNSSWPLNSWSVTENSGGYQVAYIRLLSKFVKVK